MRKTLTLASIFAVALPSLALADGDGAVTGVAGGAITGAIVGGPGGRCRGRRCWCDRWRHNEWAGSEGSGRTYGTRRARGALQYGDDADNGTTRAIAAQRKRQIVRTEGRLRRTGSNNGRPRAAALLLFGRLIQTFPLRREGVIPASATARRQVRCAHLSPIEAASSQPQPGPSLFPAMACKGRSPFDRR
jgi:hypothetical protein